MKRLVTFLIAVTLFSCEHKPTEVRKSATAVDSVAELNDVAQISVDQPDGATTDTILEIIRKLPKVRTMDNEVETLSKHQRHLSYTVFYDDSTKTFYDVSVGEDNGMSVATYFHFRVDAKTLKVVNPDGEE